jgi:hypothetical protein
MTAAALRELWPPDSVQEAAQLRQPLAEQGCPNFLRKIFTRSSHFDNAVSRLAPEYGERHVMITRQQQRKIWSGILDLLLSVSAPNEF